MAEYIVGDQTFVINDSNLDSDRTVLLDSYQAGLRKRIEDYLTTLTTIHSEMNMIDRAAAFAPAWVAQFLESQFKKYEKFFDERCPVLITYCRCRVGTYKILAGENVPDEMVSLTFLKETVGRINAIRTDWASAPPEVWDHFPIMMPPRPFNDEIRAKLAEIEKELKGCTT